METERKMMHISLIRNFGLACILVLCTACSTPPPYSPKTTSFVNAENSLSSPLAKPGAPNQRLSKTSPPTVPTATASERKQFTSKPPASGAPPSPRGGQQNVVTSPISSTSSLTMGSSLGGLSSAALAEEVSNGALLEHTASEIIFRSTHAAKSPLSLFEDAIVLTRVRSALARIPNRPVSLVSSAYVRAGTVILQIPNSTGMTTIIKVLNATLGCNGVSYVRILLLAD